MPLHRDTEARGRALDGLDDSVGGGRGDREAFSCLSDGLMMAAVDLQHFAAAEFFLHHARERGAWRYPYLVRDGGRRRIDLMAERLVQLRRDVLHERAARGDVDHLQPATDRQQRRALRQRELGERQLERVAGRVWFVRVRMARVAIVRGIDVAASGKK